MKRRRWIRDRIFTYPSPIHISRILYRCMHPTCVRSASFRLIHKVPSFVQSVPLILRFNVHQGNHFLDTPYYPTISPTLSPSLHVACTIHVLWKRITSKLRYFFLFYYPHVEGLYKFSSYTICRSKYFEHFR